MQTEHIATHRTKRRLARPTPPAALRNIALRLVSVRNQGAPTHPPYEAISAIGAKWRTLALSASARSGGRQVTLGSGQYIQTSKEAGSIPRRPAGQRRAKPIRYTV